MERGSDSAVKLLVGAALSGADKCNNQDLISQDPNDFLDPNQEDFRVKECLENFDCSGCCLDDHQSYSRDQSIFPPQLMVSSLMCIHSVAA